MALSNTEPPDAHTHVKSDVTDFPATMPPDAHTHVKSDVTDFPATLPGRIATITYTGADIADLKKWRTQFMSIFAVIQLLGVPILIYIIQRLIK